MSRLNSRGDALWGVGGGGGTLHVLLSTDGSGNAVAIGAEIRAAICARLGIADSGEGSGWIWVDDETIAGQYCGDPTSPSGCSIWTWHIPTKTLKGPIGQGANSGKGRGGSYAFHLLGPAPGFSADDQWRGVWTNTSYKSRLGAIGDVFGNGDFLMVKDYQQTTLGMERIKAGSGAKLGDIQTVGQIGGVFARGNVALWYDFGDKKLHAYNAPAPVPAPDSLGTGPFASDKQGRLWILDQQNGTLLRAWDAPVGYWLARDEFGFFPDVVALPDGRIRVTASVNQGETPGMMRVWDIDPTTGAFVYNGTPGQAKLVDTNTVNGQPASLPPVTTPVSTNTGTVAGTNVDDQTTELLLLVGALALAWYFLSE